MSQWNEYFIELEEQRAHDEKSKEFHDFLLDKTNTASATSTSSNLMMTLLAASLVAIFASLAVFAYLLVEGYRF